MDYNHIIILWIHKKDKTLPIKLINSDMSIFIWCILVSETLNKKIKCALEPVKYSKHLINSREYDDS